MQTQSTLSEECGAFSPGLEIRTASMADLPHVVRFNIATAMDQGERGLDPVKVEQSARKTLEEWEAGGRGRAFYLLALEGDRPVGQLRIQPTRFDWFGLEFWQVQHVYVEPGYRLRGVCRALLQEAQRLATLHGAGNLHLLVGRDNRAARRAYERRGFKPVHLEVMVLEL